MSILNRKAKFQYHFLEHYTAGIQLYGTEVKSIRQNKVDLNNSFCQMKNGELYSMNMYIAEYTFGTHDNHLIKRERKLLLNKRELLKIHKKLMNPGLSIVPIELFFNNQGWIKLNIVLAKGKKIYDKREILKKKDSIREMKRFFKN
ncbi:SsrA-binding protein SmpB [Blattabacterium cuenoti]|nr:SsrA-binding protein SmpB [Blattabacterium cuenoti]